jgi:4a-hydroxytetrahydrobiopterin dehydratase
METLNGWENLKHSLRAKFEFETFSEAIKFINLIAKIAEGLNHHPTFTSSYLTLEIEITTHDKGNTLTYKDFLLAREISKAYEEEYC